MADYEKLVEKMAEKIGVGIEEMKPLAETVIREYVAMCWVGVILCGSALFIMCAAIYFIVRWQSKKNEPSGWNENVSIVVFSISLLTLLPIVGIVDNLLGLVAPHYYLLKTLLR